MAPFQQKPYPLDAQPMTVHDLPRLAKLPEASRPGFVVSCRTAMQVQDAGHFSVSSQYATRIHLFYERELPDNRFLFRFRKNPYGEDVTAIPAVANLLPYLGDWRYHDAPNTEGTISVDIVGMIYLKANFP